MDYRYRVENDTETYRGFFRVRRYAVAYERYRGGMGELVEREYLGIETCTLKEDMNNEV